MKRARTNNDVDKDALRQHVEDALGQSAPLKAAYKKIEKVFKRMCAMPKRTFFFDEYQCMVAAKLLISPRDMIVCEMGSGQGKSIVLCVLAQYFKTVSPEIPVVVCTSS